jgi:hypothetical protein
MKMPFTTITILILFDCASKPNHTMHIRPNTVIVADYEDFNQYPIRKTRK